MPKTENVSDRFHLRFTVNETDFLLKKLYGCMKFMILICNKCIIISKKAVIMLKMSIEYLCKNDCITEI